MGVGTGELPIGGQGGLFLEKRGQLDNKDAAGPVCLLQESNSVVRLLTKPLQDAE